MKTNEMYFKTTSEFHDDSGYVKKIVNQNSVKLKACKSLCAIQRQYLLDKVILHNLVTHSNFTALRNVLLEIVTVG